MRTPYSFAILIALLELSGCGLTDSPIEGALKEMWAEKTDCSGRGFRIIGDGPQRKMQLYFNNEDTDTLSLNVYQITSDHQAQIGMDIGETRLLFDIDLKDEILLMSKPYFSKTPSNAFWAYIEETTGESPYQFMNGLTENFNVPRYYQCKT